MRKLMTAGALSVGLALGACGSDTPAENTADALQEAAEYSSPAAANVLENAAEDVQEQNVSDPAAAQRALEAAGNAQAPGAAPANAH